MSKHVKTYPSIGLRVVDYADRRQVWYEGEPHRTYYKRIYRARLRHKRMTTGKHGQRRPR